MTRLEKWKSDYEELWQTLRAIMEETVFCGFGGGDRAKTLANVRAMRSKLEKQAQTIQEIRSLCLDPKEKDGCQTVGARVVRLCDEALEGKS